MPLRLNDIIKKARKRGIKNNTTQKEEIVRPWQQENLFFDRISIINNKQIDNKQETNRQQIDNKQGTQPITQQETNRQQIDNKLATKHRFSSLVGLQRYLIELLYNECKIARSKSTENLTLEYISKKANTSSGAVKTSLQRLEKKRLLERKEYKCGRGGWTKYSIPDVHFQNILQYEIDNKSTTNREQNSNKSRTQLTTQTVTTVNSSSSNINKTITTSDNKKPDVSYTNETKKPDKILDLEWQLDIEPLSKIGFTTTHLKQIAEQNKLRPKVVQDSIYAFAFDLEVNNRAKVIKGDPINYFMGILRHGRIYAFSNNYESPHVRSMRIYLEKKIMEEKKKEKIEKDVINLAFDEWFLKLTDIQKKEYLPKIWPIRINSSSNNSKMIKNCARDYFEKEVWPKMKMRFFTEKL